MVYFLNCVVGIFYDRLNSLLGTFYMTIKINYINLT